ncbi:restriction endonuclease subunit S [Arenibacterium sp. LLYu02]|uniref:restriction endonuclease subunit S n=1 Tax=Arenibacterium sp. LLYu02 TaxID=3404132 RepID=UPI003B2242D4
MSWPTVRITEVARVVGGATPKSQVEEYWGGTIRWATPKDLSDLPTQFIRETPRKITEVGLRSCSAEVMPEGSVLFSSRAPIGHVAITQSPMATNQGFKSFVPGPKLDAGFLYWWLDANREHLQALGTGATFKEVSKATVQRLEIPLPPLEEQKRIAGILDQAAELCRLRTRALDTLNTLGQAIFHEMFGDISSNSRSWPLRPVGEVTDCIVPGRTKPKSFTGSIPWITTGELQPLGVTTAKNSKAGLTADEISEVSARVVPIGSVVMTCVGDLGVSSIAGDDMVINQQLHAFLCGGEILPEYLVRALPEQKGWMLRRATQTTLPYMNKSVCNSIPIPVPPVSEQEKFARRLDPILTAKVTQQFCATAQADLFASLQHRAFRGEL